jgi:hypothetical protein
MHIVRQSPTELVVKDSSLWMSAICGAGALFVVLFGIAKHEPKSFLAAAFFVLFAAITARGTTFIFEGFDRVARWQSYWLFKNRSGTVRFDDIRDVTVEAMSTDRNAMTFRLVLQTTNGPVPMANAYGASRDSYASLRQQILAFLKPGLEPEPQPGESQVDGIPPDLVSSIQSLLAQRRRIDAVALLRSRERISLAEAKRRIDAMDPAGKAEIRVPQL